MAIAKVVEISSASPQSFEEAIREGIARTARTVEGIQGAWVKEQSVVVEDGKVKEYRVILKITFLVHD
jgi:flavin-binding protein dodecin